MSWDKDTAKIYQQLSQIVVPDRAEQIAILISLIPFSNSEPFRIVELASGEGYLAQALRTIFPEASILALDYEQSMRDATQARLGDRGQVDAFDMRQTDWFDKLNGADVVVSSLCVHHLDGEEKQRMFHAIQQRLSDKGVLLIADLIAPQNEQANHVFASMWDISTEQASHQHTASRDLFELFQREKWNLYHFPDPQVDKPSSLFDQLQWLKEAGFPIVDCFWMKAGHAIFGGYKGRRQGGVSYAEALSCAEAVLE